MKIIDRIKQQTKIDLTEYVYKDNGEDVWVMYEKLSDETMQQVFRYITTTDMQVSPNGYRKLVIATPKSKWYTRNGVQIGIWL